MSEPDCVDHCLELLSQIGSTRSRKMFSGHGLYVDGLCIALVIRDVLYLKVDDEHRAAFEAAHCQPLMYTRDGITRSMSYYTAPEEAMESPAEMTPWSRRALAAAVAARAKAKPKRKAAPAETARPGVASGKAATTTTAVAKPAGKRAALVRAAKP